MSDYDVLAYRNGDGDTRYQPWADGEGLYARQLGSVSVRIWDAHPRGGALLPARAVLYKSERRALRVARRRFRILQTDVWTPE